MDVRSAATAVVNGLEGTGAELAIIEFGDVATTFVGYTQVTSPTTTFDNYITSYPNAESDIDGGFTYTNWDDGLSKANDLNDGADGPADLIIFVTDGNPTAYNEDYLGESGGVENAAEGFFGFPTDTIDLETSLWRAIEEANCLKVDGTHILGVGVTTDVNSG